MDERLRKLERDAVNDPQAAERFEREKKRADIMDEMTIEIDGEVYEIDDVREIGYGDLHEITVSGSNEAFIVSESGENAGKAARERWEDMAENDPSEFRHIVGDETLVNWAMGQWGGPGSTQVRGLNEWLDLWLDTPEEEWAGYDGAERAVARVAPDLEEEIGYKPTVAYRSN